MLVNKYERRLRLSGHKTFHLFACGHYGKPEGTCEISNCFDDRKKDQSRSLLNKKLTILHPVMECQMYQCADD